MQSSGRVGNLQLSALRETQALFDRSQLTPVSFSTHSDQASPVEGLNTGQFYDNTLSIGSAYPYGGAPSCLPVAGSPGISHAQTPVEGHLHAGHLDVMTTGYFWSNEQGLPTPVTEECAGLRASVSFPVGVMSPPTSDQSRLSTCSPTGFVGSRDDSMGGREGRMGCSPLDRIASTPANLEDRFDVILDACKAAGYQSIDSMATEYYTASFSPNSYLAATQSRSRSQDLPELLDNLYAASSACDHERQSSWAFNESERFREKILRLATNILIDEVGQMDRAQGQAARVAPTAAEENSCLVSPGGISTECQQHVKENVSSKTSRPLPTSWLTDRNLKVPETRSSLSQLLRHSGASQSRAPHPYMPTCGSPSF